jgi:hypothetical protein
MPNDGQHREPPAGRGGCSRRCSRRWRCGRDPAREMARHDQVLGGGRAGGIPDAPGVGVGLHGGVIHRTEDEPVERAGMFAPRSGRCPRTRSPRAAGARSTRGLLAAALPGRRPRSSRKHAARPNARSTKPVPSPGERPSCLLGEGPRSSAAPWHHGAIMPHSNFHHSVYLGGRSGSQPCAV